MVPAFVLLIAALLLSAFFTGAEIGLYRANRVRLQLDALAGDRISRELVKWFTRPGMFVATVLLGIAAAHFLAALALVLGIQATLSAGPWICELLTPLILTPLLFVYGELLPKTLYSQAPNRWLLRSGWPLVICICGCLPFTTLFWSISSKFSEWLTGESPQQIRQGLARREPRLMLAEQPDVGVLQPVQRWLAHGLFAVAALPAGRSAIPTSRFPRARLTMSKVEIRRLASRHQVTAVPVEAADSQRLIGYFSVVDLYLDRSEKLPPLRPLIEIPQEMTQLAALMRLQSSDETLARVLNAQNQTIGYLTARHLTEPLFRAS